MPADDFRIFVSAVSSEFGKARDAVAADLRARGLLVKVQSDFRQESDADTTLRKLHDYIADCAAVICIMGTRSGACPPPAAAQPFADMLPAGIGEASYTQWEFFFARHHKRDWFIYIADANHVPDKPAPNGPDRADLQAAFIRHIVDEQGLDRDYFSNVDQLGRAVLKQNWPDKRAAKPIVLPYPSIGSLFKGRGDFLRRLRESLTRASGGQTAITSQALYGLGGIGKTRTAVEYAWAHAHEYNALLFVVAETPEALRRNFTSLAGALVPDLDTTDDTMRLKAALDWLKVNPGWFLILDNVDTQAAMDEAERVLSQLAGGHVVITSRLANFSAHVEPLALDVLADDDAVSFLLERTKGRRRIAPDDATKVGEVAQELGQLALALEQAGAYIARHRLTFGQYLEHWRSSHDGVLAWSDPTVTGYPRAVAATWQTSVAELSEGGRRLLERLAWLAPEKLPEALFDVAIPGVEAENPQDAFDDLSAYSLVTRDADGPFFLVHRLVQDVTRRSLSEDAHHRSLLEALNWINAAFDVSAVDVRNWPKLNPLAPHARAVTEHAEVAGNPEPTPRLMHQLALLLDAKALHAQAEPLMRRALAIHEKRLGPHDPSVAVELNNLAQLLYATNRLTEAEPLLRRALEISEAGFGADHPNVTTPLSNLAQVLQHTDRAAEAEPLMRRALAIDEASYGPDHPTVAIRLNNLAQLLLAANRLNEAEPLMRRALAIDEARLGPDHPNFAIRLNNLANLLHGTGRLAEAEPLMRRALAIDEASLGPNHPNVAIRLNNLARLLHDSNRLAEAEPLMLGAAMILVRLARETGHPHPNLDQAFNNYAWLLHAMGRSAEEIEAALEALQRPPH